MASVYSYGNGEAKASYESPLVDIHAFREAKQPIPKVHPAGVTSIKANSPSTTIPSLFSHRLAGMSLRGQDARIEAYAEHRAAKSVLGKLQTPAVLDKRAVLVKRAVLDKRDFDTLEEVLSRVREGLLSCGLLHHFIVSFLIDLGKRLKMRKSLDIAEGKIAQMPSDAYFDEANFYCHLLDAWLSEDRFPLDLIQTVKRKELIYEWNHTCGKLGDSLRASEERYKERAVPKPADGYYVSTMNHVSTQQQALHAAYYKGDAHPPAAMHPVFRPHFGFMDEMTCKHLQSVLNTLEPLLNVKEHAPMQFFTINNNQLLELLDVVKYAETHFFERFAHYTGSLEKLRVCMEARQKEKQVSFTGPQQMLLRALNKAFVVELQDYLPRKRHGSTQSPEPAPNHDDKHKQVQAAFAELKQVLLSPELQAGMVLGGSGFAKDTEKRAAWLDRLDGKT